MWKQLTSGSAGAAALAVAAVGFNLPLGLAAGVGGAVYLGVKLLLDSESNDHVTVAEGLTRGEAQRIIKDGENKVARIRRLRRYVRDRQTARQMEAVCLIADKIFLHLRSNPKDVRAAQRFLEYYLDATVLVIGRYVDLSRHAAGNPEVQKAMHSFAEVLTMIEATFDHQYERLLREGVLDFDTELSVLKQMIQTEGI